MNKIAKIIFYSNGHNGDIHYSRNFVKNILKNISVPAEYRFNGSFKLVKDIENISFTSNTFSSINNNELLYDNIYETLLINTWIGSSNAKFIQNEIGCSLTANYEKYKHIYSALNLKYEKPEFYIPEINWEKYDIHFVDEFLINNKFDKYVLISNGNVLSGQSTNFNFDEIVRVLSTKNKTIAFILTDNKNRLNAPNIFYTSDFIKTKDGDLNEIAYLGSKSNLIIGRGSGPFCFCHNKTTLFNKNITFLALTKYRTDGLWALPEQLSQNQANQIWSNQFDNNSLYSIINEQLK
jgi:hypothetical protein